VEYAPQKRLFRVFEPRPQGWTSSIPGRPRKWQDGVGGPLGTSSMPVAFKEWAVTVRALAEGEQLLTLRKGGIREENKHFEIEHDHFFLYPTFDHQRNDLVRESHMPELGRALEEGVWPEGEPPAAALTQDGGIPQ